ncbi:MAG TPA: gamma-glutamyl-gamma-aminobutyrate hydrolase family protein [Gemmatimonadales bacterium]|nr:gamma-glutamyl-gamma-aminobutyrate hydrolase family protein [Gemmatimonadales bacterium]
MSAPRIAIGGVARTWDGAERTGVNAAYVRSVLAAGGVPIILSPILGASYAPRALDGIDGVVLSGGEDIHPAWYGSEPSPHLYPPSRERDLFELALFAAARQRGLPMLGVCRGIQLVNVAMGGTLHQDLPSGRPGTIAHDPGSARTMRSHGVELAPGSRAAEALGATTLMVNSFHHQGIDRLANGLVASGWSGDGLIEAVETGPGSPWLLAVQWHPEEMHDDVHAPDRGLFRALVNAAAEREAAVLTVTPTASDGPLSAPRRATSRQAL